MWKIKRKEKNDVRYCCWDCRYHCNGHQYYSDSYKYQTYQQKRPKSKRNRRSPKLWLLFVKVTINQGEPFAMVAPFYAYIVTEQNGGVKNLERKFDFWGRIQET